MPIDGRRQILKRVLVFAIVAVLLALMVSSASADDGNIKGDISINSNHVVQEPPTYPNVAPGGEMTVESGGSIIVIIITS
jgi:hypothetical protein